MIEDIINFRNRNLFIAVAISMLCIALSGLFFGFIYFVMDTTQTALQTTDCVIDNNTLVSTCQELFDLSIYPFLALKEILIWFSYFFIFVLVLALLVLGYQSGESPVLLGVMIPVIILYTYGSILMSNLFRDLIEDSIVRNMLLEFDVYVKVMLNFPWFIFLISVLALILGVINFQRSQVNTNSNINDLNY